MFARDDAVDHKAFASRAEGDRRHFRFIISPEDAEQLEDLRATTRDLMRQVEADLKTRLDWVGVDHWNTDNPHVHVLVRGVADDGNDLVISRDYISRGLRERAQEIVSRELGPRTATEIDRALEREIDAERWTSLDRRLKTALDPDQGVVDLRPRGDEAFADVRRLIGRAQVLQRYGLAEEVAPGRWRLVDDLEARLRELSLRGDIIKTLHRAMGEHVRDPSSLDIASVPPATPVVGRVVERGLHDELNGTAYVVVDGTDGRLHHFRFADLAASGDTPVDGIVEVRAWAPPDGAAKTVLVHRSDLSIDAQVNVDGATWLDRQIVAQPSPARASHGFGAEVQDALDRRLANLAEQGLVVDVGGERRPAKGLLSTLRERDLDRAAATLTGSGRSVVRLAEGDLVSGVYTRRLDLASGRFALIDDGLGFQLVPWTRALDAYLGTAVRGAVSAGGVEWSLGKSRGLGL